MSLVNEDAVRCLPSKWVCIEHDVPWKAHETPLNSALARLTVGNALLSEAVTIAIWGETATAELLSWCACSWDQRSVKDGMPGADWATKCACWPKEGLLAEHKPKGAPAQWTTVRIRDLKGAGVDQTSQRMSWVSDLIEACDKVHAIDACARNHPIYYTDTDDARRIVGPQILAYFGRQTVPRPVTVITDRKTSGDKPLGVNTIWSTGLEGCPIDLDEAQFPIRSTAAFLDDLGSILDCRLSELDSESRSNLRAVVEALWHRADRPAIGPQARDLMRQAAIDCAEGDEHSFSPYASYLERKRAPRSPN